MNRKTFAMIRAVDKEAHKLTAVVSTKQVDRYGSIILPSAFEGTMDGFMANPVILWSHNPSAPPIGRATAYRITESGLELDIEFAVNENPLAAQIFRLYEAGYLKGFSVGGYMKGYVGSWSSDEKKASLPDYAQEALKAGTCDFVITLMELLEVSACSIPANPGALKKAVADGVITRTLAQALEDPVSLRMDILESRVSALEGTRTPLEAPEREAPSDDTPQESETPEEPSEAPQEVNEGAPGPAPLAKEVLDQLFAGCLTTYVK